MHNRRLWWRLFIAYLWVPIALLLIVGFFGSQVVWRLYEDQLFGDLEARARLVGKPIDDLLSAGKVDRVDALCKELGPSTHTRITVVLPSGKVVGDSHEIPGDMDNHANRPEIQAAMSNGFGRTTRFSSTEQEDRMYVAVRLLRGDAPAVIVRTSLPLIALTQTLDVVRGRTLACALLGTLLYGLISLAISRRMSRPLEQIKAGAERFAAGELSHRLRVAGYEEAVAVADALNRMAEQLDERIRTVLRQQHEREAMLASMEEGILAIDNQGTILSLNKTCAALLGGEAERLEGRGVYEVIRKPDLLAFVESALVGTAPVEDEIRIAGPQDRWVSARGTALFDSPRGKIGVLIVLHDITRLRRLEEVRRDFVANVSHELRTPITSLKGFVETLLDGACEDRQTTLRFLQIMLRQVNRLDSIIGDLLALSRVEKGAEEQMIERTCEPIREVLAAAVEMCQKKAADKPVAIEWTCPDQLVGEINAALLEQALINLLDNAIKYSEPGSKVEITAAAEQEEVVIRVKDQGCGIEARHLPRLFERFYRVDKARSRQLGGTGLGLAIVRHIALAHHGSVSVESTVGMGSTFFLRLPMAVPRPTLQ